MHVCRCRNKLSKLPRYQKHPQKHLGLKRGRKESKRSITQSFCGSPRENRPSRFQESARPILPQQAEEPTGLVFLSVVRFECVFCRIIFVKMPIQPSPHLKLGIVQVLSKMNIKSLWNSTISTWLVQDVWWLTNFLGGYIEHRKKHVDCPRRFR